MRFDAAFAAQSPEAFVADVLVAGLGARYVLVGDDFRYGARRAGDYAMLDAAGARARLRRRAHDELRGARPARLELGGARRARRRRHGRGRRAARPALQRQRPRRPRRPARPRRSARAAPAAATAFAPSTSASRHPQAGGDGHLRRPRPRPGRRAARRRRQPRQAADGRRQRPRPARGALPRLARGARRRGGLR